MPAPHDTPYAPELQYLLEQDRLRVVASFNSSVVEPWLVEKMLAQFDHAMQQLTAADKDTAVGHVNLLTPVDSKQLWEWNHKVPVPVERCIHGVFADPARTRPEALAIYAWDGELTYGELDSLSNRLAHYLVDQGVIPEMVVPLYFEKSMWTTVAILAVLKAGGAFLLLDPLLRAVRLAMLCSKVHATVAVASRSCHTALHALQVVSTALVLNSESVVQLPLSTCPPHVAVHPHHTVYVVFTSGSTGEPKACRMEHRSSCSTVVTHVPALGINRNTRTLQFTAYSFAGSLAETLLALVTGGCVCVPSEQQRREGFAQAIVKLSANWSFMTSTILSTINIASVPTLRTICTAQELAALRTVGQGKRQAPRTKGEKQLQNLWAEVLDLPSHSIGRDDGFFQLGGDSMVAMRLVGAAGRDGAGLTMAHVFNNPKLSDLAVSWANEDSAMLLDTVHPETLSDMLPLTSFQNDWVSTITAQSPAHTVHYSWLELSHQVTSADVTRTCKALLDRYPIMRLVFLYLQQEWWQVVLRPNDFDTPFQTVRLEAEFKAVCERDTETLKQDQCPTCFILDQHESDRR
ncbi:hypothetical protein J3E73DRAFT_393282 [Bipolaris maydis]|nr:hypothetical protein J3E73DRAFT_393282 [Bipolaris maydis]